MIVVSSPYILNKKKKLFPVGFGSYCASITYTLMQIELQDLIYEFYTSTGDIGIVRLNRPEGVTFPAGRFCCGVPDLCINIG